MTYAQFIQRKRLLAPSSGFDPDMEINSKLFQFQRDIVRWALRRGRAAIFADCGLGKTAMQLEWAHHVSVRTGGNVLILTPPAVGNQTCRVESPKFGIDSTRCFNQSDVRPGVNVTNYERLHLFSAQEFAGVVLDESSILKAYDGKTRTQIIDAFLRTPYKLACTATPAPNDFMELGNHAEFLGVMTRAEMLATFFVHDGGETSKWRLKGHAESDFWRWLCSWAVNIRKPSDLGYSDDGFVLPPLDIVEHCVDADHALGGMLFAMPASSLDERRQARRESLSERVEKCAELTNANDGQWLVWCNLNAESEALASAINGAAEVTGDQDESTKERLLSEFTIGKLSRLVTKPTIAGYGMNLQNCHNVAFVGLSDSYEQFYQAIRRCWRFGQTNPVTAHVITSNLEGAVVANIKRKESDAARMAEEMVRHMADITSAIIRGNVRTQTAYTPCKKQRIPQWLQTQAA